MARNEAISAHADQIYEMLLLNGCQPAGFSHFSKYRSFDWHSSEMASFLAMTVN